MQRSSIQNKIVTLILLSSGLVLLLTFAAYFLYEYYSFKRTTVYQLSLMSRMLGANASTALIHDDTEKVSEIVSSLQVEPHIRAGGIYNRQGQLVATYYHGNDRKLPQIFQGEDGFNVIGANVEGSQEIMQQGKRIGYVYLVSDMTAVFDRFLLYTNITGLVFMVAILAAYFVSKRLQRNLSAPILHLAEKAKIISENHNYSIRAVKHDDDEVGLLTESFNKMLERIESQNREILNFTQSLEAKVKERTIELENAYEELEAFSYTVSHDLSAPLRHIEAFMSQYLEENEQTLEGDNKRLVANTVKYARKMRQLIDDLLTFSQLSRKELAKTLLPMKEIVENVLVDLDAASESTLTIDIAALPSSYGDLSTIQQVWTNLLSNAIKYSRKKDNPHIEIGFETCKDSIVYFVKDNGAGFDMRSYNKLFNAFQRLHPQSQFEGTGVGLAIVQRIITKHHGKVWAESEIEKGSTFYFSLPTT